MSMQSEPLKKAVVLAAGKGTRMRSELPKALAPVCGRSMIFRTLDALDQVGIDEIIVVVGYRGDLVREALRDRANVTFAVQTELLGTGHAVMSCRDALRGFEGPVFIVAGDNPMLQSSSVERLFQEYAKAGDVSCVLGSVYKEEPFGMGRILRNANGDFVGVVEEKDATPEQRLIKEVNMSYYVFHTPSLLDSLGELRANNAQREYYITDVPKIMLDRGQKILAAPVLQSIEALGVNTPEELALVEETLHKMGSR